MNRALAQLDARDFGGVPSSDHVGPSLADGPSPADNAGPTRPGPDAKVRPYTIRISANEPRPSDEGCRLADGRTPGSSQNLQLHDAHHRRRAAMKWTASGR